MLVCVVGCLVCWPKAVRRVWRKKEQKEGSSSSNCRCAGNVRTSHTLLVKDDDAERSLNAGGAGPIRKRDRVDRAAKDPRELRKCTTASFYQSVCACVCQGPKPRNTPAYASNNRNNNDSSSSRRLIGCFHFFSAVSPPPFSAQPILLI